jgi:hypothetical protein
LQKHQNVKQWNNTQKKFIDCKNTKQWLVENICTGQTSDNIPNICTSSDWAKARAENVSVRASPFATARFKEFYDRGIDACKTEQEKVHFKRNEKLIDFDMIPSAINNKIVRTYMEYEVLGTKAKILKYLMANRMKLLIQDAGSF